MSSQDQVWNRTLLNFTSLTFTYFRLHQTRKELEIVFASDTKNGLSDAVFRSFKEVTEEIGRRTDRIAGGDSKNVRWGHCLLLRLNSSFQKVIDIYF